MTTTDDWPSLATATDRWTQNGQPIHKPKG